jgi:NADPH-dependent 7-cyano-7-deazaguanine reductase QueF
MRNFPFSLTLVFSRVISREMKTNCLIISIIDWADAKITLFGVSLAGIEVVLSI